MTETAPALHYTIRGYAHEACVLGLWRLVGLFRETDAMRHPTLKPCAPSALPCFLS